MSIDNKQIIRLTFNFCNFSGDPLRIKVPSVPYFSYRRQMPLPQDQLQTCSVDSANTNLSKNMI